MPKRTRRSLRLSVTVAGVAALGALLSGTAFAAPFADESSSYPDCEPVYPERNYSMPGYNGNRADDFAYNSDDYRPECTGFHGESKDNGYNGYNGTDDSRNEDNNFLFSPW